MILAQAQLNQCNCESAGEGSEYIETGTPAGCAANYERDRFIGQGDKVQRHLLQHMLDEVLCMQRRL